MISRRESQRSEEILKYLGYFRGCGLWRCRLFARLLGYGLGRLLGPYRPALVMRTMTEGV